LGAIDIGGALRTQHPGFPLEVFSGILERALHEVPALLGEGGKARRKLSTTSSAEPGKRLLKLIGWPPLPASASMAW